MVTGKKIYLAREKNYCGFLEDVLLIRNGFLPALPYCLNWEAADASAFDVIGIQGSLVC